MFRSTVLPDRAGPLPDTSDASQTATRLTPSPYEKAFAGAVGAQYSVAFGYARHALISILEAAGARAGDEVILSPLTCKVVPLALLSLKLKPVYADISAETLNLNPQRLESAVGSMTRVILFQHTYGNSAGVEAVARVAARKNLVLVEDCAQCLPFAVEGYRPGSFGRAAIFSNNLLKPMPAGSGGMAVTNDQELATRIQMRRDALPPQSKLGDFRHWAEKWAHEWLLRPTWYWRLFNLNRAVSPAYRVRSVEAEISSEIANQAHRLSERQMRDGANWLRTIEALADHRQRGSLEYAKSLRATTTLRLVPANPAQPLFYFPVLASNKVELLRRAQARRVELIAWPISAPIYPLERVEDLQAYGYERGECPVAEVVATQLVGLPTHPKVTGEERRRIIELLMEAAN